MKLKTMMLAALGALTLKTGKALAKKKAHDAMDSKKSRKTYAT